MYILVRKRDTRKRNLFFSFFYVVFMYDFSFSYALFQKKYYKSALSDSTDLSIFEDEYLFAMVVETDLCLQVGDCA